MSLASNESAESKATMETDSSSLSQENSWRHIALFFKILENNKAACTKCSKVLKIQQGTSSNLKIHYQRYHPSQVKDLQAALEGTSKRGDYNSSQDTGVTKRQDSIEETFMKLSQKQCLDLYYRSFRDRQ